MASFNVAQIMGRAREILGRSISDQEAQEVMGATGGGDESQVIQYLQYLKGGGTTGGGGNPADAVIQAALQVTEKQGREYESRLTEFEKRSPFVFDKVLEQEQQRASQRLDPYYNQTLADYLRGIETRRTRSREDEVNLLTELSADVESYTGNVRRSLDRAINRSREGFADAGLYFSGQRFREEGELKTESDIGLADYLRGQGERERGIKLGTSRLTEDLSLEERLRRRDIGREQVATTRIESLNEATRRQQLREQEKATVVGAPPGIDPFQFQYQTFTR